MDLWKESQKFHLYARNATCNFVALNVLFVIAMVNVMSLLQKSKFAKLLSDAVSYIESHPDIIEVVEENIIIKWTDCT